MKKTLLAAALTVGVFGVAQAETSVTLYGVIDEGVGYTHTTGHVHYQGQDVDVSGTNYGLKSGNDYGSRWGLKGVEDLGDGLNVVFQLESGFDENTGNSAQGGRLFGRQATVGFQNDSWGRLDFGRQTNIASKYIGAWDPMAASFRQANAGTTFGSANTYRVDNMIMYQTPNFSGFQFGVGYSFNANGSVTSGYDINGNDWDQTDNNATEITTGLRYVNGPIAVAATYDQLRVGDNYSGAASDGTNVSEWNIGGSYDFEVIKAYLGFGQLRNGNMTGFGGYNAFNGDSSLDDFAPAVIDGFKANAYLVGLSAPLGTGEIMASWQMSDPSHSEDSVKDTWGFDSKQNIFGLAYRYPLSKRTVMYAYGSYTKNAMYQDDLKTTDVGIGFRHSF